MNITDRTGSPEMTGIISRGTKDDPTPANKAQKPTTAHLYGHEVISKSADGQGPVVFNPNFGYRNGGPGPSGPTVARPTVEKSDNSRVFRSNQQAQQIPAGVTYVVPKSVGG